ncbi:MAG: hypothetical protein JWO99_346 [Candidatus Saccharibacteria bacterium]|nr:hypothetical protein [Candidatus Saccharibacteria bacterium]
MTNTDGNTDQIEELLTKPLDDLYEGLGDTLADAATECLNQALGLHGGFPVVLDGVSHNMTEYIGLEMLPQVLTDARRLAKKRDIVVGEDVDTYSVVTDDDAIRFILGSVED